MTHIESTTSLPIASPLASPVGTLVAVAALLLGLTLASASLPVLAADKLTAQDCAQLTNRAARLACFDQLFGSAKPAEPSVPSEAAGQAPAAQEAEQAPTIENLVIQTPAAKPQAESTDAAEPTQSATQQGSGSILSRKAKVNFDSTVKALRAKDKQRMVFLLENGEVWMQSSPRNLPIKEGDAITIKSGLMGGYIMRSANGVSTRVNRIK